MESLSRISSLLETARDLTLEAAQSASAAGRSNRGDKQLSSRETRKLLNSRMDREVLDGLRRVISIMSRGVDCSEFFADVVKNVASPTLEIKKLVYIYLLRYAESEPDLALLSINTIQKALNDQNQLVRAMAIRVMSGIRVPVISQIVALAIKKGVTDMSAYVRKCAAFAIPKCYKLDPSRLPQLTEYLGTLLGDPSYFVVGAAVMAYQDICPDRWDLIHPQYRSLVKMLIDMDEWGQLATLRLLTNYARHSFPLMTAIKNKKPKIINGEDAEFYSDDQASETVGDGQVQYVQKLDPDLELLLKTCPPLLQSRNSAVIVAVARVFRHLAPTEYISIIAGPLVSLLRAPVDVQHIALINIVSIALKNPRPFSQFATHFLVNTFDPPHVWRLKLEVLTLIFPEVNTHTKNLILSELEYFAQGYNKELVKEAVRAIGRCAQSENKNSTRCLRVLLRQVESSDGTLVAESLTVIRHIIQQNPDAHSNTVIWLAKALDKTTNPSARASIIWLVGEYSGINNGNNISADTLRLLAGDFSSESEAAKQQIVLLAAKVYTQHLNRTYSERVPGKDEDFDALQLESQHPIALLFSYVQLLARYDLSYDLRDRARMYKSLLSNPSSTELATLLLLAPKPTPHAPSPSWGRDDFTLGSAAMVVGKEENIRDYVPLSDWVSVSRAPSPALREPILPPGEISSSSRGALTSIGIASKARGGGSGSGSPSYMSSTPMSGTPKFSQQLEPRDHAPTKSTTPIESLEDFLASDETEEESTDEEESGEDEDDEEEDDDEEESEESEDSDNGHKESSQLLGASGSR
ncbi:adaptin N terminal region-domain-containing protein [Geopyxis carbonaria]|nr:adaptin N terminal region-domain-containing protein [Geopyxis carbonaria]